MNLGTDVDAAKWKQAVTWVARSDDIAGTCFVTHHGEAIQRLAPDYPVFYVYVDLLDAAGEACTLVHYLTEQSAHHFNLTQTPLLQGTMPSDQTPPGFYDYAGRDIPGFDTSDVKHYWSTRLQKVVPLDFALPPTLEDCDVRNTLFLDEQETSTINQEIPQTPA